ncbi:MULTISPECIES: DNA-J related domain-containing protein [unclassified Pseudoalteromonas]|uniref:DNA-J related domain-containing protein n=1 Tax=unclassified Pseudoalteromonas TaxID=194690 RepID=UPI0030142DF4
MFNPLVDAIFNLICQSEQLKVHTIAAELMRQQQLPQLDDDPNKDLFKRNFLIMNALYTLQGELAEQQQYLHVAALNVYLDKEPSQVNISQSDPLREYYLDWQNYETSSAEVAELLDNFWRRFGQQQPLVSAKNVDIGAIAQRWGLPEHYDRAKLSKYWRRLALAHHPDKAGDEERFKELQDEYEALKLALL